MKATKHIDCEHCESRYKSIFCDLKGEHLASINEHKGCNIYKKGQTIFSEGFFPQGLFCINAGKVKVAQVGDNGREQIIRLTKDGDILGYRALLSGEKYSASAVAIEDCSVCLIPKDIFFTDPYILTCRSRLAQKNTRLATGFLSRSLPLSER